MIRANNLKFTYEGASVETLRGLNFEIAHKEIFGFLGPSGSGKSTTQKILFGLLKTYSGDVEVFDKPIRDWDAKLYERIGISFELPNHYSSLSAAENLEYFQNLYDDTHDVGEVLSWVGLEDASDTLVENFSKGMKARLNFARSVLHKPKLLFLDEPTSGLDPVNAHNIMDLVKRLRDDGTTVFITTHNMTVADELCDRVAFLIDGQIDTIDSPATLKKRYGKRSCVVIHRRGDDEVTTEFALDDIGMDPDFRAILDAKERIESIHSQETTLEQVFIQVTGRGLQS